MCELFNQVKNATAMIGSREEGFPACFAMDRLVMEFEEMNREGEGGVLVLSRSQKNPVMRLRGDDWVQM